MKTLKSFAPVLLAIGLIITIVLAVKLCGTAQEIPPPMRHGDNPSITIFNVENQLPVDSYLFLYYIDNDSARLVNSRKIDTVANKLGITVSCQGRTSIPFGQDPPGLGNVKKDGFDYGQNINMGIWQDGKAYRAYPHEVNNRLSSATGWKWYPLSFYVIDSIIITHETFDVYPTQYAEWLFEQCPVFPVEYGDTISINFESHWLSCHTGLGKLRCRYIKNKNFRVQGKVRFFSDYGLEIIKGDGLLKKLLSGGTYYYPSLSDYDKNNIIIKVNVTPYSKCDAIGTFYFLKYTLSKPPLPEGAIDLDNYTPPVYVPVVKPKPDPIIVDKFPLLDFTHNFIKVFYADEFLKIGADENNNLVVDSRKKVSLQLKRFASNRRLITVGTYGPWFIKDSHKRYFNINVFENRGTFDGSKDKIKAIIFDFKSNTRSEISFIIPKVK